MLISAPSPCPAGALLPLLLCVPLAAQIPLGDTEEQRRRAQEEAGERSRLQRAPNVQLQEQLAAEGEPSLALPSETPSFRIERLVLEAPPGFEARFRFARRYLEQYRGRQIGPEGIQLILRRLTRRILGSEAQWNRKPG
jgi:hemolysin activation/secretion protein